MSNTLYISNKVTIARACHAMLRYYPTESNYQLTNGWEFGEERQATRGFRLMNEVVQWHWVEWILRWHVISNLPCRREISRPQDFEDLWFEAR